MIGQRWDLGKTVQKWRALLASRQGSVVALWLGAGDAHFSHLVGGVCWASPPPVLGGKGVPEVSLCSGPAQKRHLLKEEYQEMSGHMLKSTRNWEVTLSLCRQGQHAVGVLPTAVATGVWWRFSPPLSPSVCVNWNCSVKICRLLSPPHFRIYLTVDVYRRGLVTVSFIPGFSPTVVVVMCRSDCSSSGHLAVGPVSFGRATVLFSPRKAVLYFLIPPGCRLIVLCSPCPSPSAAISPGNSLRILLENI